MSSVRLLEGNLLEDKDSHLLRRRLTTLLAYDETRILSYGADSEDTTDLSSSTTLNYSSSPSSSSYVSDDDALMIAWYAFIGVAALVLGCVIILCAYKMYFQRVRGPALEARREERRIDHEAALLRMQTNVDKFTAQEEKQRTRDLCILLESQTTIVRPGDPRLRRCHSKESSECSTIGDDNEDTTLDAEQPSSDCVVSSWCCLICLEGWREGDVICQSAGCAHIFHQTCIVAWLVHHRNCPSCRQVFWPTSSKDNDHEEQEKGEQQQQGGEEHYI